MSTNLKHISEDDSKNARVIGQYELEARDARWVTLKEVKWVDESGRERRWEAAERKTRASNGIDGAVTVNVRSNREIVAVIAIIRPAVTSEVLHTVVIEQYRPPVGTYVVEAPAGLIDEGEDVEKAGIRELEEETGLKASSVLYTSPLQVCDAGMTTANMKVIVVNVPVQSVKDALPDQKLQGGEHIVRRVLPLDTLNQELKAYTERGFVVDARLSHFAIGWELSNVLRK